MLAIVAVKASRDWRGSMSGWGWKDEWDGGGLETEEGRESRGKEVSYMLKPRQ